ncbi:MAG: ABC transporter permease [Armatimonadota bacterium]
MRAEQQARSLRKRWRRVLRHQLMLLGAVILLAFATIAAIPSVFATHDPFQISIDQKHQPPSASHWFGTDELGRDVYSRVIYGIRLSLTAGFVVVAGSLVLGTLVGIYAGYRGGFVDDVLMRMADVFLAFPGLVMAMAFVAALGPSLRNAMLALLIIWWPQYSRLARGQVLALRHSPFVEAALAIGIPDRRILFRHILPNIFGPIFVKGTLDLGHAVLVTAGLSFLGLGARPPEPELGALVTVGRSYLLTSWWYSTFPGFAIFLAVLAVNLVGDGLRDLLDPTLRQS